MSQQAVAFNTRYGLNVSANSFVKSDLNFNVANDLVGKPKRNILQVLRRFFTKPSSVIAVLVVLVIIILSIVIPQYSPHSDTTPIVAREGEPATFANLPPAGIWETSFKPNEFIQRLRSMGMVEGIDFKIITASNPDTDALISYNTWDYASRVASSAGITLDQVSVLGTDDRGRDVWTRVWSGTWESLKLGVFSALGSAVLGTVLGCLVGLRYGSWLDIAMNRLLDAYGSIPYLVWVSILITVFPQNSTGLIGFFIITSWTISYGAARFNIVRFLNTDYMRVAKISGVSALGRIFKHALPNFIGIIALTTMSIITSTIISQAYIGILDFSFLPDAPYLGNSLQEMLKATSGASQNLRFVFVPTLILIALIVANRYIAIGINDAVDPKFARR